MAFMEKYAPEINVTFAALTSLMITVVGLANILLSHKISIMGYVSIDLPFSNSFTSLHSCSGRCFKYASYTASFVVDPGKTCFRKFYWI